MARNAQRTAEPTPQESTARVRVSAEPGSAVAPASTTATATVEHLVHGLVAIANGPDYCLCGATWPCSRREDRDVLS